MDHMQRAEPDAADLDAASQSLFRLGRAFGRLPMRELLEARAARGTELSAILIVQAVAGEGCANGEVTIGDIAVRLGVDPSTASRLVAQAVTAGYLRRVAVQRDRRATALELTEAGRALDRDAARYQRAVFDAATASWAAGERQEFARLFVRFAGAIEAALRGEGDDT